VHEVDVPRVQLPPHEESPVHSRQTRARRWRLRTIRSACLLLLISLALPGCYAFRAQAPLHPGVADSSATAWAIAWGLIEKQPRLENCHGQGLAKVTVRSNFFFELMTVATLGFVSVKRIEWTCAEADPRAGTFGTDTTRTR